MSRGHMKIRHNVYSTMLVPFTYAIYPAFVYIRPLTLMLTLTPSSTPKASKKVLTEDRNNYGGYIILWGSFQVNPKLNCIFLSVEVEIPLMGDYFLSREILE